MSNQKDNESQIELALSMSEEDLLQALGAASSGNNSVQEARDLGSLLATSSTNKMVMAQHKFSTTYLADLGKAQFAKLWPQVKDAICDYYLKGTELNDKDLASYLVSVVVGILSITNALAVLLVALAIKYGLDMLCPAKA